MTLQIPGTDKEKDELITDMYEALKTISAFYSDTGYKTVFPSMVEAVRKVNKALAKANGE